MWIDIGWTGRPGTRRWCWQDGGNPWVLITAALANLLYQAHPGVGLANLEPRFNGCVLLHYRDKVETDICYYIISHICFMVFKCLFVCLCGCLLLIMIMFFLFFFVVVVVDVGVGDGDDHGGGVGGVGGFGVVAVMFLCYCYYCCQRWRSWWCWWGGVGVVAAIIVGGLVVVVLFHFMHLGAAPDYRDQCACNFTFAVFNLSLCTVVRSCNGIVHWLGCFQK